MMNKMLLTLAMAAVLSAAGCASSPNSANDNRVAQNTAKSDSDLVCKRTKPIGSNMTVKTCQTRAEADAEAKATQDELRKRETQTSRTRSGN